jgi:hypothetical protein
LRQIKSDLPSALILTKILAMQQRFLREPPAISISNGFTRRQATWNFGIAAPRIRVD